MISVSGITDGYCVLTIHGEPLQVHLVKLHRLPKTKEPVLDFSVWDPTRFDVCLSEFDDKNCTLTPVEIVPRKGR